MSLCTHLLLLPLLPCLPAPLMASARLAPSSGPHLVSAGRPLSPSPSLHTDSQLTNQPTKITLFIKGCLASAAHFRMASRVRVSQGHGKRCEIKHARSFRLMGERWRREACSLSGSKCGCAVPSHVWALATGGGPAVQRSVPSLSPSLLPPS